MGIEIRGAMTHQWKQKRCSVSEAESRGLEKDSAVQRGLVL